VSAHFTQLGTFSIGWGVAEGGARPRYTVGHSSAEDAFGRRFESRERLLKTGSCGSLNSLKEPTPTQSFSAAARKIRRGRARVLARGSRVEASQCREQELRPSGVASSRFAGARQLGKMLM
jgi:hypothetical protein